MTEHVEVDAVLPGDPEAVEQLVSALRRAAELLRGAADRVAMLGAPGSVWEGPVAQGFVEHVSGLSRRVAALESDLSMAATQLETWREGLMGRRQQLAALREEMAATPAAVDDFSGEGSIGGGTAMAERERQQAQLRAVVDEHEVAGMALAHALRRVADAATDPAGALDGTAWLLQAEMLLHELDQQVGGWVSAQGPALSEAVTGISQTTAVSATVAQAAGSITAGLDVALGAAVVSVAAAAPGSHRLIASARRARTPIPLETLPPATFAAGRARK